MVYKGCIALCLCLVAVLSSSVSAEDDGRIVDGVVIDIKQAPYAVQLKRHGFTACGGALITQWHVLTAAHCVDSGIADLKVVGSASKRSNEGVERSVSNYMMPKEYTRDTLDYDIAVLKLDRPIYGGDLSPVEMATQPWTSGQRVMAVGWGRMQTNGALSPELRAVTLYTLTHEECLSRNVLREDLSRTKECAYAEGKDTCQGDSGGPLVHNGELWGVVSSGHGCADPRYPGIYTSVYTMRKFIYEAMDKL